VTRNVFFLSSFFLVFFFGCLCFLVVPESKCDFPLSPSLFFQGVEGVLLFLLLFPIVSFQIHSRSGLFSCCFFFVSVNTFPPSPPPPPSDFLCRSEARLDWILFSRLCRLLDPPAILSPLTRGLFASVFLFFCVNFPRTIFR